MILRKCWEHGGFEKMTFESTKSQIQKFISPEGSTDNIEKKGHFSRKYKESGKAWLCLIGWPLRAPYTHTWALLRHYIERHLKYSYTRIHIRTETVSIYKMDILWGCGNQKSQHPKLFDSFCLKNNPVCEVSMGKMIGWWQVGWIMYSIKRGSWSGQICAPTGWLFLCWCMVPM